MGNRNLQDATLRNIRALKKDVKKLKDRVKALEKDNRIMARVRRLEDERG